MLLKYIQIIRDCVKYEWNTHISNHLSVIFLVRMLLSVRAYKVTWCQFNEWWLKILVICSLDMVLTYQLHRKSHLFQVKPFSHYSILDDRNLLGFFFDRNRLQILQVSVVVFIATEGNKNMHKYLNKWLYLCYEMFVF